jgi:hypothetical protein
MYRQPQRVIFTDASQFAGAGFTVGDNKIVHFMWEKQDREQQIDMCKCLVIIGQMFPNAGIIKIIFPQILAKFLHVNCV